MKYQVGQVGRCVVARFEDGDPILDSLIDIAKKEAIRAAIVYLVGGITEATIVVGPDKEELPPNPVWRTLTESHEAAAIGTIFWEGNEPKVHIHGSYGKRDMVKVGCLREQANTESPYPRVIRQTRYGESRLPQGACKYIPCSRSHHP